MAAPKDSPLFAFTCAIQPLRRAWVQAAGQVLETSGVSVSLATVILFAARLGPDVRQKTLALEVGVNAAAMVRLLDQAEAAGMLTRSECAGDRRGKAVNPTPAGQAFADRLEAGLMSLRDELFAGVDLAEIEAATRLMRRLEANCLARIANPERG